METFEVAIIGAGIHGASAAFHLAERKVETVIFDSSTPAGGPTGRSSAICRAYYTNAFLAQTARASIGMLEHFADLTGGRDAGYRETGVLFLHPSEDVDAVTENATLLRSLDIDVELIAPDALTEMHPYLRLGDIRIGAWERNAGYADPAGTTSGLFDRAVELGATARTNTTITDVQARPGGGAIVVSSDGTSVACEKLLIAAGPWTKPLAARIGVDLPLTVERHIVATYGWGTATPIPFGFADLPGGYYFKPEGADLFCLGPLAEAEHVDPDDFDEEIAGAESDELAEALMARWPGAAECETRGGWASLYDVSPDWQPVIGEIADGIFVDAGTSGHGFKLAPALGRHVADLVCGKPVDPGLTQFHPSRFNGGEMLGAGYGSVRILG